MSLFKIFRPNEWHNFEGNAVFKGSVDDLRDGFIHFSAGEQMAGTLAKYYINEPSIIIARVDNPDWGHQLKWEVSRGGAKFPHLYTDLHMDDVKEHWRLDKQKAQPWDIAKIISE